MIKEKKNFIILFLFPSIYTKTRNKD